MKKPMEQLKEIMGVEEQSAADGTSKELLEVKKQIKEFLTIIQIIKAIAIILIIMLVIGGIGMIVDNAVSPNSEVAVEIYKLVKYAVTAAVVWYICAVCSGFCREIDKSNTPFIPQVPKGLRKIAVVLVAISLVYIAAEAVYSQITHTEFELYIDAALGAFVFILLLLSSIFDYGCKLQKESDETL